jgi:hypothetical protein
MEESGSVVVTNGSGCGYGSPTLQAGYLVALVTAQLLRTLWYPVLVMKVDLPNVGQK